MPGKKPAFEEKPVSGKNRRDRKRRPPAYCLGSAKSLAADFFLVWLMSTRSDPLRCDESPMRSPSEEKTWAALLLWAAFSRTVPAVCTGPPCQEMAQIQAVTKSQASAWNSTNSCLVTKVLSLSRKNLHDHCWERLTQQLRPLSCCPLGAKSLECPLLNAWG